MSWPAIVAVVLIALALALSFVEVPHSQNLQVVVGLAAVTSAVLSLREK
jgi:hypothetical protein